MVTILIKLNLDELLQKEITRKQFIASMFSAVVGLLGITTFLGVFTKNVSQEESGRPGYGKQGYGP
ncbi:MAG TPA: hypothetical protein VLG92_02750 [Candidatus Saccharimonadia bacterium]|nr:hypothetical protein [Candidatus Saccharimonadia bacterium]